MGKEVDSTALSELNRILGIAGSATGAAQTDLDDGNLTQVIDVGPVVRRSRTLAGSAGLYFGILRNIHAAAGQVQSVQDPYTPTNTADGVPSALPVQRGLEWWLLGASATGVSGAGTLDEALLQILLPVTRQAWGVDSAAGGVSAGSRHDVARWETISTLTTNVSILDESGQSWRPLKIRLGRGMTLRFVSDVAGAAATIQCVLALGLFPTALGQDGVG